MSTIVLMLDRLGGNAGFVVDGVGAGDWAGWSVSGAGDINGDGLEDFVIGARYADPGGLTDAGTTYVVFGTTHGFPDRWSLAGLDGTNGFVLHGIDPGDLSGFPVSSAGDFNGDGIGDLLVGANVADPNGLADAGEAYVIFGRSTGFAAALSLDDLDGANGFGIEGIEVERSLGRALSSAGDVNGDGLGDIVIGASGFYESGGAHNGTAYVIFGTGAALGPDFDLASLDGSNGFVINGVADGDRAGFSVSDAGDVNGDGIGDLIVGARFAGDGAMEHAGEAYVVFGRDEGFPARLELADLDGSNGFAMSGLAADEALGFSVSHAGDVNGDGFGDVIVGARSADPNGMDEGGSAYVVFGRATGFSANVDLAALDGSNGFRVNAGHGFDFLGHEVNDAGDFNGDGIDDLVISAPRVDGPDAHNAGQVYVLFGRPGAFQAVVDVDNLAIEQGLAFRGVSSGDEAGYAVAGAGDVNGDGFDDLIIGAPTADNAGGAEAGEIYIVYGFAPGNPVNAVGTGEAETFHGSLAGDVIRARRGDDTIYGRTGNDVLNGDGGDDAIFGDGGDDTLTGGDGADALLGGEGSDFLNGRAGVDTMVGGEGDDIYVLDNLADAVVEEAGGGRDVVRVSVSGYEVGRFIEEVRLFGRANEASGSARDDVIIGGSNDDTLSGRSGDDRLVGHAGNDRFEGGAGADTLDGGAGDDAFWGRFGNDTMLGGAGNDRFYVDDEGDVVVELGGAGHDIVFASIDRMLSAHVEELWLIGGAIGGKGNELDNAIHGSDIANVLRGGGGDDLLLGGAGDDTLYGGADRDTLIGGDGADRLTGYGGADVFGFESAGDSGTGAPDTITDFSQGHGDVIDLRAIDANSNTVGDDSFQFVGGDAFSGEAGELRFVHQSGTTVIFGDVDGDGVADFRIRLEGTIDLTAGDFYV